MISRFTCFVMAISVWLACFPVNAKDVAKPKLMLANIYHEGVDLNDYLVSEKYDGVRALWNGKEFVSRGGNVYHAPKWFIERFPKHRLDGELWVARQSFELLLSIVRDTKPDEEAWKKVKYMVFDLPDRPVVFEERLKELKHIISTRNVPWLFAVKQQKFKTHAELMMHLDKVVEAGAEGLMLHKGSSYYRAKRTGDLLKLKKYEDDEAIVIQHIAGKGKYKGKLGALRVEMSNGVVFKIGSGFTDNERANPPEIGSHITFQFRGLTKNGIPKFASFLRVRQKD